MRAARANGPMFLVTLAVFLGLDAAWLWLVAMELFQSQLGTILRPEPLLGAAIAFYLIYSLGIVVLAVRPALAARAPAIAAGRGAMLGLVAYATFDLTNLAVIRGWTLQLAVVDMAWGIAATAAAALAGYRLGAGAGAARAPDGEPTQR